MIKLLLLLLSLAILSQNTCPYGFAAKTEFAASHTHDCPLKKSHHSSSKGQDSLDGSAGKVLYPGFVFSISDTRIVILDSHMNTDYIPLSPVHYTDPLREPSTRPPAA